jgi:hypothetical protein
MLRIKHLALNSASTAQFTAFEAGTKYIVLDVQDADARVTFDTSAASTSNGHILYAGRSYTFSARAAEVAVFARKGSKRYFNYSCFRIY